MKAVPTNMAGKADQARGNANDRGYGYRWQKYAEHIRKRDLYVCQACGAPNSRQVDHVVPRKAGGSDEPENLQTLCQACHADKTRKGL